MVQLTVLELSAVAGVLLTAISVMWAQLNADRKRFDADRKEHIDLTMSLAEKVGESAGVKELSLQVLARLDKIKCKED